jgi:hypothetical protein
VSRVTATLIALLLIVVGSIPFSTAEAAAAGTDLTCTPPSSASLRFDPPLTNSPQPSLFSISRQYGPCVAPTHPEVTAGVSTVAGLSPDATCARLLGAQPVTITITWNTGQTTTLSGNSVNSIVGVNLISTTTGTVTAGLFAGDTFVHTAVYTGTDLLLCLADLGTVSSLFGQITLEIVAP